VDALNTVQETIRERKQSSQQEDTEEDNAAQNAVEDEATEDSDQMEESDDIPATPTSITAPNKPQPPTLHLTNNTFTMAKLFDTMADNNGSCTMMYDEIPAMYDQIEGGGKCDRRIFLSLNGGDTWSKSTKKGGHHSIDCTHFNYSGKYIVLLILHLFASILSTLDLNLFCTKYSFDDTIKSHKLRDKNNATDKYIIFHFYTFRLHFDIVCKVQCIKTVHQV
jgi:hypothetical protein